MKLPISLVLAVAALAALVPAGVAQAASDEQLLHTYQPVTSFDAAESFFPTNVKSFVRDATLEQLGPSGWAVVDADPKAGDLPGPGTGTWRLNQQPCSPAAALGGLSCYDAADTGKPADRVYGRVLRTGEAIVLQYWYFYYDDVYSYFYPPSDVIWQAHEGDWEVVNVVLSPDEEPLFAGYSQHCLGQRRAWAGVPTVGGTHPLVYVAAGSHANYFTAGVHQFDVRCVPPQAQAVLAMLQLPLPNDYALGGGLLAGPPDVDGVHTHVKRIDEEKAWVSFPGFWGELQFFHGPGPIGTVPFGTAPVGPAYHDVWLDPLATLAAWSAA